MRDEYRIVYMDPVGERASHVFTIEASSIEEAVLKAAVKAAEDGRPLKGRMDYKLALQEYNADVGTWETIEDMKAGADGRWFV